MWATTAVWRRCWKIQSAATQKTHDSGNGQVPRGELCPAGSRCTLPMTLKNLCTFAFRGCGHSATRGAVTRPGTLSESSPALTWPVALLKREGVTLNLVYNGVT